MLMPRRSFSSASAYKFGFNGKENDNEVKGLGNQQDYGMRIYDARVGRFLSTDPLTKNFPWYTPYQFAGNMPIAKIDLDGSEPQDFRDNWVPKSMFVLKTKQQVGNQMLITDPKLGKNIDVEMIYDNWTKQVWFVHQDDRGNWLYLKNDNGVHTEMSIDPKTNILRGGAFVPFETQDQLQGKYMRELADGTGTAMAVIIATIAGGIAIDGALSTYGTKAVGDFVVNEIKDELVDQAKESLGIPDFNPRDLKDAVDGAKNIVKKKGVDKFEVSTFDDLQTRSLPGDGLDLHHFPQKHPAKQVIPGYDPQQGTAMTIPNPMHKKIPTEKGTYSGTARDLLAKDARKARNAGVPNSAVQKAVKHAKNQHPSAYKKSR